MSKWKIAGINFDHLHMGDNLRVAFEHPDVEIVGLCDEQPERMKQACEDFAIPADRVFTDYRECLEKTRPDIVLLCPATAEHGEWTEKVAPFGVHIIMEKPFAATLAEADQMQRAMEGTDKLLAINWPLAWYPPHRTAQRLIAAGEIGEVIEVHYYDGNRGPLWHLADKVERTADVVEREKPTSWFYKKAAGGGSLLDYLGYGTTLGTWYMDGRAPIEVTATVDQPQGLEVDEHCIAVARYERGLSKFETRWGHLYRSLDPATPAQVRLRHRRQRGHDQFLRLRGRNPRADASAASNRGTASRCARTAVSESRPVRDSLHRTGPTHRGAALAGTVSHRPTDRRYGLPECRAEAHVTADSIVYGRKPRQRLWSRQNRVGDRNSSPRLALPAARPSDLSSEARLDWLRRHFRDALAGL